MSKYHISIHGPAWWHLGYEYTALVVAPDWTFLFAQNYLTRWGAKRSALRVARRHYENRRHEYRWHEFMREFAYEIEEV